MPDMIPPPIHHLEPPHLIRRPAAALTLHITLHEQALGVEPARLQPVIIRDLIEPAPATAAPHGAEDAIRVVAPGPIEGALLGRAGDAAGGDLGDVDVGDVVGRGAVFGDGERDGGGRDEFAEEPSDVLLERVVGFF